MTLKSYDEPSYLSCDLRKLRRVIRQGAFASWESVVALEKGDSLELFRLGELS